MYIEFQLRDSEKIPLTISIGLLCIRKDLIEWSQKYGISYTEKTVKYTHRVCLNTPEEYTFFLTSWQPTWSSMITFKVIDIP